VRFLVDAQLPPALAAWLRTISMHLADGAQLVELR